MRRALLLILLLAVAITVVLSVTPVGAVPSLPGPCIDHVSSTNDPEADGDVRCAGRFIDFHVDGVAHSPHPLWAGQWAVIDGAGALRRGWCVHNRGAHPTTAAAATARPVALPHDPDGRRSGYLTWRYGDTDDPDTAAALWALFHWYAQDAAGTARAVQPSVPLLATLDSLAAMTGDERLQRRAQELLVEGELFGAPWDLAMETEGSGVVVSLRSATTPVAGQDVQLTAGEIMTTLVTDDLGVARIDLGEWFSGAVVATAESPGPSVAWWGPAAWPDPQGVQPLLSAGPTVTLTVQLDLAPMATTTTSTTIVPEPTTTAPETTTVPETTTEPETTTTTEPSTTTTSTTTTTTTPETTTPDSGAPVALTLPIAGGGTPAPLALGLVVAGIGLIGAMRRRTLPE